MTCSHCGSARGTLATIEGDGQRRQCFVCLACNRITSPLTCGQFLQRGGVRDWCGAPAVAVCSGCAIASCARCVSPRKPRGRRTPAVTCRQCATKARADSRRRHVHAVRELPHPAELWYSGVEK